MKLTLDAVTVIALCFAAYLWWKSASHFDTIPDEMVKAARWSADAAIAAAIAVGFQAVNIALNAWIGLRDFLTPDRGDDST